MQKRLIVLPIALCTLSATAPVDETPATKILVAFKTICAAGDTNQKAELARADALGWRSGGADTPRNFSPSSQRLSPSSDPTLVLTTIADSSAGEARDSCGISGLKPVDGLAEAAQAWLGFAPTFAANGSASFVALRSGDKWEQSPKLDPVTLDQVKREGRLYSFMVLNNGAVSKDDGYSATLALFRFRPIS